MTRALKQTVINDRYQQRGFTLVELLLVAAIITIFAGVAIFSVQEAYDQARRKSVYDEVKSVGSAMELCQQNIGFYPRFDLLSKSRNLILEPGDTTRLMPGFDFYCTLKRTLVQPKFTMVKDSWYGPYMNLGENRNSMGQGKKGMKKMRVNARIGNAEPPYSLVVDWPCDAWSHPYVFYQVVTDPLFVNTTDDANNINSRYNPQGLRLINSSGELENQYMTFVLSYGPNGYPGGPPPNTKPAIQQVYYDDFLSKNFMYVEGDTYYTGTPPYDVQADYMLRTMDTDNAIPQVLRLRSTNVLTAPDFGSSRMARTFYAPNRTNDPDIEKTGIFDSGSDDIFWKF